MKLKYGLYGALCMFALTAHAQSSVTLYGIIDTGVEYVSHANASGNGVVRMPSITGELPSRWGLRGTEDLGAGYKALFVLENGFNVGKGDIGQGGRLFGRQSWVGVSGPYGTLSFGRQYTMTYLAVIDADVIGPNIYGMGSLDSYIPNARSDNTIAYKATFSGLTVGASYSFGRDSTGTGNSPGQGTCAGQVAGNETECRSWSAMVKYDAPWFGVAGSYEEQRGGKGAAANLFDGVKPLPLTADGDKDDRAQLNGYVKLYGVKVASGWIGRWVDTDASGGPNVHSDLFYVSASYQVVPSFIVDGGVYRVIVSDQDARATLGVVRGTYLLSKSTALYVQGAYLGNSKHASYSVSAGGGGTTPAPGQGQFGAMVGIRHFF
ncbi:porin [Paraburkholderia elongata]|uniref:Porin n=1 Tax=Paraburkholderia elongata TaxID=2675747 RepID=A0A972SQZ2_9BURK|nr:porin [Paraburkholderia elongata]NPT62620.1 porin [Paraburkholderia elongata]